MTGPKHPWILKQGPGPAAAAVAARTASVASDQNLYALKVIDQLLVDFDQTL